MKYKILENPNCEDAYGLIEEALRKSYYKPWHKRLPGKMFTAFIFLVMLCAIYFSVNFFSNLWHLQRGDISNANSG